MTNPKLIGIRAGDRVRLEVEFTLDNDPMFSPDGAVCIVLSKEEVASAKIERIEEPLKVGMVVMWNPTYPDRIGEIVKVAEDGSGRVWIFDEYGSGEVRVYQASDLERVPS